MPKQDWRAEDQSKMKEGEVFKVEIELSPKRLHRRSDHIYLETYSALKHHPSLMGLSNSEGVQIED